MEQQKDNMGVALETISEATLNILGEDLNRRNQFCDTYKNLMDSKQEGLKALGEVKLPIVGDVSGGKSSLINTLCKFPISPVAKTTTSAVPLEIRYASSEAERLEIAPIVAGDIHEMSNVIYTCGKNMQMEEKLFRELYDYAVGLGKKSIIQVEDTLEYFSEPNPEFLGSNWQPQKGTIEGTIFNPKNRRHVMHLLLILLGTYVFQDKPRESLSSVQQEVLKERDRLMKKLKIPNDITYIIRLYWCSELIPKGTVIIDLPGLGAAAEDGNGQMKHDVQVQKYMDDVPSLMFLLTPEGKFQSGEAKLQLDSFIATNKEKQSPARTLFVLNKADIICERKKKKDTVSDEDRIRTVVNQYITNSPEYEDYPFYAISARAGERYFAESGIPLDNMIATKKLWELYEDEDIPTDEMRKKAYSQLNKAFNRKYVSIIKGKTEQMDLQTFVCRFFSEEVGKIRLLQIIDEIEKHFSRIEKWASKIDFELKQLEVAYSFGKEIFDLLSKKVLDALNQIINEVLTVFSEVSDDFHKTLFLESVEIAGSSDADQRIVQNHKEWQDAFQQVCDRVQKQGSVIKIFEQCDNKLSSDINKKIEHIQFEQHMTHQGLVIPLDKNAVFDGLVEVSTMAKKNYARLVACGDDIAKMNFVGYFEPAFQRLRTVFNQDRQVYGKLVNKVTNTIRNIPTQMQTEMDRNFESVWDNAKELGVDESLRNDFQKLYTEIVRSMTDVLNSLFDEVISRLKKDTRLESVVNVTLDNIRAALTDVLSPYTTSFGDTVYNQVIKGVFIVRMNQQQFNDFVKNNYIDKFSDQMKNRLKDILYGGSEGGTQNAHTQRIGKAIIDIRNDYLSSKKQKQIKENLMASVNEIRELSNTPVAVHERCVELLEAIDSLQQFFGEDTENPTVYGWLKNFLIVRLENADWANTTLSYVNQKAEEAKEKVEAMKQFKI